MQGDNASQVCQRTGLACYGWRFWSVEGTEEARKAESAPKASTRRAARKTSGRKAKGGTTRRTARKPKAERNGATPAKPIACGHCGEQFPDGKAAAKHTKAEHGAPEAPGSGGPLTPSARRGHAAGLHGPAAARGGAVLRGGVALEEPGEDAVAEVRSLMERELRL